MGGRICIRLIFLFWKKGTSALHELFAKIDADPDWFPGKHSGAKRGPAPLLTPAKRLCIARSAMAAKSSGDEPCVAAVVHNCPKVVMGF